MFSWLSLSELEGEDSSKDEWFQPSDDDRESLGSQDMEVEDTKVDNLVFDSAVTLSVMPPKKQPPQRGIHLTVPTKHRWAKKLLRSWLGPSVPLLSSASPRRPNAAKPAMCSPWLATPHKMAWRKSTTLTSRHWTFPPPFSEWLGSTWWNEVWFFDGLSQVVLWGGLPHHPTRDQLWWELCSCPVLQGFSCAAYVQDCIWTQSFCCRRCPSCWVALQVCRGRLLI